jgi:hypothetical protein
MTLYDIQKLADLHYECYDAALTLRLHKERLALVTPKEIQVQIEKYVSAQREIIKIINKYGTDGFVELGEINKGLVAA